MNDQGQTNDLVTVRLLSASDESVLFGLYASVRAAELRLEDWEPAARDLMLRSQFEAQKSGYREQFPAAEVHLILRQGSPIGWIIVDRSGRALHGIDIALIAAERGNGIGARVIRTLQEEAAAEGRSMVITVQRLNQRAQALYRRLGFRATRETDLHIVMEWRRE